MEVEIILWKKYMIMEFFLYHRIQGINEKISIFLSYVILGWICVNTRIKAIAIIV
jgi:hypothetical protein